MLFNGVFLRKLFFVCRFWERWQLQTVAISFGRFKTIGIIRYRENIRPSDLCLLPQLYRFIVRRKVGRGYASMGFRIFMKACIFEKVKPYSCAQERKISFLLAASLIYVRRKADPADRDHDASKMIHYFY